MAILHLTVFLKSKAPQVIFDVGGVISGLPFSSVYWLIVVEVSANVLKIQISFGTSTWCCKQSKGVTFRECFFSKGGKRRKEGAAINFTYQLNIKHFWNLKKQLMADYCHEFIVYYIDNENLIVLFVHVSQQSCNYCITKTDIVVFMPWA